MPWRPTTRELSPSQPRSTTTWPNKTLQSICRVSKWSLNPITLKKWRELQSELSEINPACLLLTEAISRSKPVNQRPTIMDRSLINNITINKVPDSKPNSLWPMSPCSLREIDQKDHSQPATPKSLARTLLSTWIWVRDIFRIWVSITCKTQRFRPPIKRCNRVWAKSVALVPSIITVWHPPPKVYPLRTTQPIRWAQPSPMAQCLPLLRRLCPQRSIKLWGTPVMRPIMPSASTWTKRFSVGSEHPQLRRVQTPQLRSLAPRPWPKTWLQPPSKSAKTWTLASSSLLPPRPQRMEPLSPHSCKTFSRGISATSLSQLRWWSLSRMATEVPTLL